MKPKISVVMAHYNRFSLLEKTLNRIYSQNSAKDLEIVVVDDGSTNLTGLTNISDYPIHFIQLPTNKWYINPVIPFNVGIEYSSADIVMLQNPECWHLDNPIAYSLENLKEDDYFSFSCYSLSLESSPESISRNMLLNRAASFNGDNGWYNHSIFRAKGYHFCSATTRKNLQKVGNFSRSFAQRTDSDDDDLVDKLITNGNIPKIIDECSVLHQYHYHLKTKLYVKEE